MDTAPPRLPDSHLANLQQIEHEYWWHISRVNWAQWLILSRVPQPSERHALDFGCGTGGFLHNLNNRIGFKSHLGVDTSPEAIEAARRFGNHYRHITSDDFSQAKGKDLIFLMDVLEHIQDDAAFLKELFQTLPPAAFVLICVPAMPSLYSSWDRVLGHYRRYGKDILSTTIAAAGGRILWVRYIFSYLAAPILVRRVWNSEQFNPTNCEFPPVSPVLNTTLIALNRMEIKTANLFDIPFGSSLLCLVQI